MFSQSGLSLNVFLGEKQGTTCYSFCMGCDPRPFPRLDSLVETNVDPDRCLTVSINWGIRLTVDAGVRNLLSQIAEECELRLSQGSLTTSDICLKVNTDSIVTLFFKNIH